MSGLFYAYKMPTQFEKNIAEFIKSNGLFSPADKVLLAVSGGIDSTALLYVMAGLKAEKILNTDFVCAHINHQLRGSQADLDKDFVIAQATKLKFAIITRRLDVHRFARRNKLSIETAARTLRIESLLDIAKANNCSRIATGHQKNDNVETVLQRLIRGTGFRGLGGIWPKRSFADNISFVRPLLCVTREEIVQYLKERNLKWQVDSTNADCNYRRNYIRHRLLPALQQQCNSSIVEQLSRLAESACKFYRLVCDCADKAWPELTKFDGSEVRVDLKKFASQAKPVKVEIIRRSLSIIGSGEKDLTQKHFRRISQLAQQNISGRKIELPGGFVVHREYAGLIFARAKEDVPVNKKTGKSAKVKVPGQTRFGNCSIQATILETDEVKFKRFKTEKTSFVERFDLDKISLPLIVRLRENGDRFQPLGLAKEKKVGKFLTAAKVPQQMRRKILVVADREKIIWVRPIRISEKAKVTSETDKILQLQITDVPPAD